MVPFVVVSWWLISPYLIDELAPGAYTVLVWCEAFSVEFVGATIIV